MAKKKTATPKKKKTASNSKPASSKPKTKRALSNGEIGAVAGDIWRLLEDQSEQSLTTIKSSIDAPADLVVAAVGWLAREEKLVFNSSGRTVMISLRH